jgi:hypothetical protein
MKEVTNPNQISNDQTRKGDEKDSTTSKQCASCKSTKLIDRFYKKGERSDSNCKECELKRRSKKRHLKRISEQGAKKRRTKMVEIDQNKVREITLEKSVSSSSIASLLNEFVIRLILDGHGE